MSELGEAFAKLIREARMSCKPEWQRPPPTEGFLMTESMTTEQLKALWDGMSDEANHGRDGQPHLEDVHLALNLRGEGDYCAV